MSFLGVHKVFSADTSSKLCMIKTILRCTVAVRRGKERECSFELLGLEHDMVSGQRSFCRHRDSPALCVLNVHEGWN